MNTIKFRHYFDAGHMLTDGEFLVTKACTNLHGHTYAVEVEIYGHELKNGLLVDFKAVKEVINLLDHKFLLNEIDPFSMRLVNFLKENKKDFYIMPGNPTSENIGKHIFNLLEGEGLQVRSVAVKEGYKGENTGGWTIYEED